MSTRAQPHPNHCTHTLHAPRGTNELLTLLVRDAEAALMMMVIARRRRSSFIVTFFCCAEEVLRGERRGAERRRMSSMIEWCEEERCVCVWVGVHEASSAARSRPVVRLQSRSSRKKEDTARKIYLAHLV